MSCFVLPSSSAWKWRNHWSWFFYSMEVDVSHSFNNLVNPKNNLYTADIWFFHCSWTHNSRKNDGGFSESLIIQGRFCTHEQCSEDVEDSVSRIHLWKLWIRSSSGLPWISFSAHISLDNFINFFKTTRTYFTGLSKILHHFNIDDVHAAFALIKSSFLCFAFLIQIISINK